MTRWKMTGLLVIATLASASAQFEMTPNEPAHYRLQSVQEAPRGDLALELMALPATFVTMAE